jgi:SAM-dependent methyltransferase
VIDPKRLFSDYGYRSETSPGLSSYFFNYADHVANLLELPQGSRVLDVGSNDGTLLRHFKGLGMDVLGVDPARQIAESATKSGIPTINAFFDMVTAKKIIDAHGSVKLCTANNVFAHNDRLGDMADAIEFVLDDDGVFVFEVSYLLDTVRNLVFDFIYHEHLCYHSVFPMRRFLRAHGLELFHVERTASKGGTLRGFAQKTNGKRPIRPSIDQFLEMEGNAELTAPTTYTVFSKRVENVGNLCRSFLEDERRKGTRIWGYGASATVTTLLFHFGIGEFFEALVDDNSFRIGTVSPGLKIPVRSTADIYTERPGIIAVLAWRFSEVITRKHGQFIADGGRFLIPMPEFRLIDATTTPFPFTKELSERVA